MPAIKAVWTRGTKGWYKVREKPNAKPLILLSFLACLDSPSLSARQLQENAMFSKASYPTH